MTKYEWIFLDMEINEYFGDMAEYHFYHFVIITFCSKTNLFHGMV